MCFSASASFVTAAATGLAGAVALQRAQSRREMGLAAMPILFSVQQSVEGLLWVALAGGADVASISWLSSAFLFFALAFWPAYAPLAVLALEADALRRRIIAVFALLGIAVGMHFFWLVASGVHSAAIEGGHIVYLSDPAPAHAMGIAYLVATVGALAASSHRGVRLLGLIVLVGSVSAYIAYWDAFLSVWCFFAAAASTVIVMHFEKARQARRASASEPG